MRWLENISRHSDTEESCFLGIFKNTFQPAFKGFMTQESNVTHLTGQFRRKRNNFMLHQTTIEKKNQSIESNMVVIWFPHRFHVQRCHKSHKLFESSCYLEAFALIPVTPCSSWWATFSSTLVQAADVLQVTLWHRWISISIHFPSIFVDITSKSRTQDRVDDIDVEQFSLQMCK